RLTDSGAPCVDSAATWSPDGSRIAFARDCEVRSASGIYVSDLQGLGLQRIAPNLPDPYAVGQMAWSPDGKTLAFSRPSGQGESGGAAVYLMNVDGTDARMLAPHAYSPAWSPAGTTLVVIRSDAGAPD